MSAAFFQRSCCCKAFKPPSLRSFSAYGDEARNTSIERGLQSTGSPSRVSITLIAPYDRAGSIADTDPCADIIVARVTLHNRTGCIVSDSRVKVFETRVLFDQSGGPVHGTNPTTHVAVTHITRNERGTFLVFLNVKFTCVSSTTVSIFSAC